MNKAANTYWTDSRLATQRPTARPLTLATPARELSREIIGTRAEVRRRGGLVPSWAVFTMIMLATFALCVSVLTRTRTEMRSAEQKLAQMNTEVQSISNTNDSLRQEVRRLHERKSSTIEDAARASLNMIRPNEIVVPVD